MVQSLLRYIEELRHPPDPPSFEPEIDDFDAEQDRKLRELEDLHSGAIRKGPLPDSRPEGTASPQEGDLVYFHLTVRREDDDRVVETTRLEEDGVEGSGIPKALVLGKGLRAPRGWELALQDMKKGEKARFIMRPEYGYAAKDCRVPPPAGFAADAALLFDIHLLNWYPKDEVRLASDEGDVIKRSLGEVDSWETPRAPFEVGVSCTARIPSSSGRQGEGRPYYSTPSDLPLRFTIGNGQVPRGFEEAVCSLAKLERAIVSCPAGKAHSPGSVLPPPPEGADRVEFELHLLSMIQVRDMTGTGEVIKRRIKEGAGEFPVDCPLEDCAVRVHYRATIAGSEQVVADTRGPDGNAAPLEFNTGMDEVPEAVDMAVRLMTPQETSLVRAAARYAFDGRPDRPEGCPEGADVDFELTLVDFDRQPNWTTMTADDKLQRARTLKEQGNRVFKLGPDQYMRAISKWSKAIKVIDNAFDMDTEEQLAAASKDKVDCMTNLALVAQKQRNFTECFKWCDKALREVSDNPKALFRRATANAALLNYEAAREDFELCRSVNPDMAADVDRELRLMERQRKEKEAKMQKELKGFLK